MGQDKALLPFCGAPLVELAVAKLATFCASVSIVGNRSDLSRFAPVVEERRNGIGPVAAIEAGLQAADTEWNLFIPIDVPLIPHHVLQRWAELALEMGSRGGLKEFHLMHEREEPAFCIVDRELLPAITSLIDAGERKLTQLFHRATCGFNWAVDFYEMYGKDWADEMPVRRWFSNINTPQELAEAEAWAQTEGWQPPTIR